jgi:glutaredoxin
MAKLIAFGHIPCSHCRKVFKTADRVRRKVPGLQVEKVDIARNPHMVLRYKVIYCPALVINGKVYHGTLKDSSIISKLGGGRK